MKIDVKLAPVALFVYNRPLHTRQTVESLLKNTLSSNTDLFVFSDHAKTTSEDKNVQDVRNYIRNIEGFGSVHVIERNTNYGLAKSIISGVSEIINVYDKIIVMEDDMITSPYFLAFMNDALEYYKDIEEVWHISGWNYPISEQGIGDTFLWRVMNCYGWATWKNKWKYYDKNPKRLISEFSIDDVYRFNIDGSYNFFQQVLQNYSGSINTWAIFWYSTIFLNNGLCLNVTNTLVSNIGFDGSGIHCGDKDEYKSLISNKCEFKFSENLVEHEEAVKRIQSFFNRQGDIRIPNKTEFSHQYYLEMSKIYLFKGEYKLMRNNIYKAMLVSPLKSLKFKLSLLFFPNIYLKFRA